MSMPSPTSPKMLLQVPAFVLALVGFIVLWIALATPAWQSVYAIELRQWIQSGLWITCHTRPNGMYECTWMFSYDDFDFYSQAAHYRTPAFYPWQRVLLHCFLAVQLTVFVALVSFCVSNSGSSQRCAVAVFTVSMALATLASFILIVAFTVLSYMVEYRFYHVSVSGIYEKHRGYSFYLGVAASFLFLFSLFLSVPYLLRVFTDSSASGGLQKMASARTASSVYTVPGSRDDYRMATSHESFDPNFSFQPSYRSSHAFGSSMDDHYALKPLPNPPAGGRRLY